MPDRDKVIKGLEILMNGCEYIHCDDCCFYISAKPTRCGLREEQIQEDALSLLKEQEAVEPYIDIDEAKCPVCKVKLTRQELIGDNVLFEDFFDYCPHCGKPVLWEGR